MIHHTFEANSDIFKINAPHFSIGYVRGPYSTLHVHDFWELMIVTDGVIEHRINGLKREIKKNTVCLIRPADAHSMHPVKDWEQSHINICVREQTLKELLNFFDPNLHAELLSPPFLEIEVLQSTTNYVLEIFYKLESFDKNDPFYHRLVSLVFFNLLHSILYNLSAKRLSDTNVPPAPIKQLVEMLHNTENITCSLKELCKKTNYSQPYLIKQFQKYLGTTPVRFFQNVKMNYARELLETTELPIYTIAEKVGMSNIEHFYNNFKKMFGQPPAKYRKNWYNYYSSRKTDD